MEVVGAADCLLVVVLVDGLRNASFVPRAMLIGDEWNVERLEIFP